MPRIKKTLSLVLAFILLTASLSLPSNALNIGDTVDYALYTDIVAYIDGAPIQSYNIDGNTAIVVEDLAKYGFTVRWNANMRTLAVTHTDEKFAPDYAVPTKNSHRVGTRAMPVLYTDIKTYLDYTVVKSYNVGGRTVIFLDDLADMYGADGGYSWSASKRTLSLTLADANNDTDSVYVVTTDYTIENVCTLSKSDAATLRNVQITDRYIYALLGDSNVYVYDMINEESSIWDFSTYDYISDSGKTYQLNSLLKLDMFYDMYDDITYFAARYSKVNETDHDISIVAAADAEEVYITSVIDPSYISDDAFVYYAPSGEFYAKGLGYNYSYYSGEKYYKLGTGAPAALKKGNLVFEDDSGIYYLEQSTKRLYSVNDVTDTTSKYLCTLSDATTNNFAVYTGDNAKGNYIYCMERDGSIDKYTIDGECFSEIRTSQITNLSGSNPGDKCRYLHIDTGNNEYWYDSSDRTFKYLSPNI
jgi:hypothetical protein